MKNENKSVYIRAAYKSDEYISFYESLPNNVKNKFEHVLDIILTIYDVPVKFVKHLQGTDLYEMRVTVASNEYRTVLFALDHSNFIEAKKILLLNGFLKKDKKDYKKQIKIAETILKKFEL